MNHLNKTFLTQVSSQKVTIQNSQPEPPTQSRIPRKKPHFRCVDYDRVTRAYHLKIKLWKVHSCKLTSYVREPFFFRGMGTYWKIPRNEEAFQATFRNQTMKKCLKYLKKIAISEKDLFVHRSFVRVCSPWKLETLNISFTPKMKPFKILKPFMNSRLKHCFLNYSVRNQEVDPKVISLFRKMKKCQLYVHKEFHYIKIALNTSKIRVYSKSRPLKSRPESQHFSDQIIINHPDSIEESLMDAKSFSLKINK